MYDIIIIGAGPAGLSAAIYAVRAGRSTLVLEENAYGGQIVNTPEIENYPGIARISGFEFAQALYEQAAGLGAQVRFEKAVGISVSGNKKIVSTPSAEYECSAVIIATGAKNRELGLTGEKELVGRGISYCATCDGMFFRGMDVAVNGGGNTALEDAAFLSTYCRRVYLIHRRDAFRGDATQVERLKAKENIEFVLNSTVTKLNFGASLESVEVTDKFTGEKRILPVAGLFVAIGQVPDNEAFKNVAQLENGYVLADESCKTATPGVFTAGDCRTKTVRQLTTAASDGAAAALAASEYCGSLN